VKRIATGHRHRRRWIFGTAALLIILVCLATYSALAARSHAEMALKDFQYVQDNLSTATSSSGRTTLEAHLQDARSESIAASNSLTSTGVLEAMRWIPYFGGEIDGASSLFHDSAQAATSGLKLLQSLDSFQTRNIRSKFSNASLDSLQTAVTATRSSFKSLDLPVGQLFGPVGHEREVFDLKISRVLKDLTKAESGIAVARSLFGSGGTSTVLVLPENNAEMRDQGAILSYSLMRIHGSSLSVVQSGTVTNINPKSAVGVQSSPGIKAFFYGTNGANQIFQSVNSPADFTWSGATAAAMFLKSTGVTVDDVVALDVPAMASLLGITGPLTIAGIAEPLTESDFSTVVLHDLYAEYPVGNQIPRKTELNLIASTLLQRLRSSRSEELDFLRAFAGQIPGRHLLLWSASPSVERAITQLGASGKINTVLPKRTFHVAVESIVAAKLGYYVKLHESYGVQLLRNGAAWVTTKVTEINTAPAGQPASYQLGPDGHYAHVPGEYVANVFLWSPSGSKVVSGYADSGLMVTGQTSTVMAQHSTTTTFITYLPKAVRNGQFVIHLVPQPTLQPAVVTVKVGGAKWHVSGASQRKVSLNDATTLTFPVSGTTK
jgi:hypothetical protein